MEIQLLREQLDRAQQQLRAADRLFSQYQELRNQYNDLSDRYTELSTRYDDLKQAMLKTTSKQMRLGPAPKKRAYESISGEPGRRVRFRLRSLGKKDLLALATKLSVTGVSRFTKQQLCNRLESERSKLSPADKEDFDWICRQFHGETQPEPQFEQQFG
jgi:chromosome segregation ATPase